MSTLDGPIWSKCSIALTCPARSHFSAHTDQGKMGQGWDERYRSSREEEGGDEDGQEKGRRKKKEKGRRKEKEKTGDRF